MRHSRANYGDRSNALWGRGSRGESRSNALWGRGGRRAGAAVAMVVVFATASVAAAGITSKNDKGGGKYDLKAYVSPDLLSAIQQNPSQTFDVIVQGDKKGTSKGFYKQLAGDDYGSSVRAQYNSINGVEASLTGTQLLALGKRSYVTSMIANESVTMSGTALPISSSQLWPYATGAPVDWTKQSPDAATIAVVDSGVQGNRIDFAGHFLGQINITPVSATNSPGDGYGHGTFVSSIAAGSAPQYAGAAPRAGILSLDVMNDQGQATVSDVIKAADWILANKAQYNIKVANFSLHAVNKASVLFDPLDAAVEKLWLNGVTVVAAAGNYGSADGPSGVQFAPGNDPFVITVGATDIGSTLGSNDDVAASFSAWGYTPDGFSKPDIAAPGRYMIGAVPPGSTLTQLKASNVTDPVNGYMMLSGTSFAAPIVAAAAAQMVVQHPQWGPDQIKGALMVTATPEPKAAPGSLGVGDVNIAAARQYAKPHPTPPNPNAGLEKFLLTSADGTRSFNATAWQQAALANKAWDAAAWSDAAWSDAAWSSAAWSDAAWASVAWASVAWGTAAWSDAAWSDAAWSDAAWADNAKGDDDTSDAAPATIDDVTSALADLGIVNGDCDPTMGDCDAVSSTVSTVTSTTSTVTSTVTTITNGLLP
jgi:serine protease AprX